MTPPRRLVLWDIDGTLVSNNDSDETLFLQMMRSVVPAVGEPVHPYRHGKTDLQQVTEYLLANGGTTDQVPVASERLVEFSRSHFVEPGERTVLPGVVETVRALAADGHVNAILTGNGPARAELKLFSAGLDPGLFDWASSFFGDASESRPELTRRAAAHAAERSLRPVIVGDTLADGRAAEAAGIDFVGVATGVYRVDDLRAAPHLVVVEDLRSAGRTVVARLAE
ncbi:MAG: hydrolase [Blastococcus sp.]|jgi:phosphoglycolate phosphatase-like HAD superfamily hydrolase|nr:hydrolase [Blastococcus sp.]